MTRQKSDDRIVPEGRRKSSPIGVSRGGKAVTVEEDVVQPKLPFATAETRREIRRPAGLAPVVSTTGRPNTGPKANNKPGLATHASIETVIECLEPAFRKVAANRGAPGPDGQTVANVAKNLRNVLKTLGRQLADGTYQPGPIRRVDIPKASGGTRGLGIPNVSDRMVQEAVRMVLEPLYEPTFHRNSHGFRPNRSCHTAIAQAQKYVQEGHEWLVDIDLEKFFDRVNHQRLMARLAARVGDKRLLVVIGRMLKAAVVMPEGVKVSTDEGVPQGGPLSPLLSNIVLDELDQELERRGHRFVRYADDCNIYVRSEKAGLRVMASVTEFIDGRLRLTVNAAKSAVARPDTRHFLGYRLLPKPSGAEILLSERSRKRLIEKIRELTPRNWGGSLEACIARINTYFGGWFGHFRVCTPDAERDLKVADARARRRMRAIILRHWKRKVTIANRLIRLGRKRKTVWQTVYGGRKSTWALSHAGVVDRALHNAYFAERGFDTLLQRFQQLWATIAAPAQLSLWPGDSRS